MNRRRRTENAKGAEATVEMRKAGQFLQGDDAAQYCKRIVAGLSRSSKAWTPAGRTALGVTTGVALLKKKRGEDVIFDI